MTETNTTLEPEAKLDRLRAALRETGSAAVAFSSGVDSTFLLHVAHEELGERVVAVTVRSHTFPKRELDEAVAFCRAEGVRHEIIDTCELDGWVGTEACLKAAQEAAANGADRIGIVTSGRCLSHEDVDNVCAALKAMRAAVPDIGLCASLGLLSEEDLQKLKAAGLQRVHCNIEAAPSLFPSLCTTHTFADKLATLHAAKKLGFQICCGGIIGMGETDAQLVEFAFALKEIAPDSIPVNVLHPIAGTPLGDQGILNPERVIDSVAILRLVNPSTPLRFAGGRRDMTDASAAKCIYVGMSAGIAGPLLTTPGADFNDDRELALLAGYAVGRKTTPC